jgi:hypothetical protein
MSTHPKTGLHYIVSFRQGPAYDDAMHLYERMAAKHDWLECIQEPELLARMEEIAADERNFVVMWGVWAPRPPADRKAIFTRVFSEALDEDANNMIGYHRNWLVAAQRNLRHMDAAFGHTPWMAAQLGQHAPSGHVLPMGWHPEVMGTPDWSVKKEHRFTYIGAIAGKRSWLVPGMQGPQGLGDEMFHAKDVWGKDVNDLFNRSVANLYLSHSDIHSFSTFRIWQTLASSAGLIAERGRDCWPMKEGMYFDVPTITMKNGPSIARKIQGTPDTTFHARAKRLHQALASDFTIDKVVDNYLIPASEKIKENTPK